jgi:redox-sensitive bicupin YhaK (pirin superfamily)
MSKLRSIQKIGKARPNHSMGPHVLQVMPSAVETAEPFIFLDHFGPFSKRPGESGVPPHPHAGISTVTYLFEGSNRHRDSLGNDVVIQAGDIAWMKSGGGIIHSEGMNELRTEHETIHGVQIWVSLPAANKFDAPFFQHFTADMLPAQTFGEYTVRVLCGHYGDAVSPVQTDSPAYLFHIRANSGAVIKASVVSGYTCVLYCASGGAVCEAETIAKGCMVQYSEEGDQVEFRCTEAGDFILMGGQFLGEPIVGYASFVMNSYEQISRVISDYQAGRMGHLD